MADPTCILLATSTGWRLAGRLGDESARVFTADLHAPLNSPAAQIAAKAAAALHENQYAGQGLVLAIASEWCFSATIQTTDLPRNDRKAMIYRLEEKLPLAAEAMVADFVIHHDGSALGVCTRHKTLSELIDALEGQNIAVQSIAPLALLAGEGMSSPGHNAPMVVFMADEVFGEGVIEVLAFEGNSLVNWAAVPARVGDVQLHLDMISMLLSAPPVFATCGLDSTLNGFLQKGLAVAVKKLEPTPIAAALEASQRVLAGRSRPWVEFRRGPLAIADRLRLHRKPLNAALAAAVVLMMAVALTLFFRAHRYALLEASADQQVADGFREQFPGWDLPANMSAVIESEHRKAAATAALGTSAGQNARSAFQTFKDVLSRLPSEGRISIRKMSFEGSSFDLEGQIRSYEQLDGIAAAARKAGMEVATPESRKNAEGNWDFTIHGAVPASPGSKSTDDVARGAG